MDYTLSEIVKHKNNISNLSIKLINTLETNQEIFISEELIKETQFLLSLLNIKKKLIVGQNFANNNMNFNPMQNQINTSNNNQFQQMMPPKQIISTFNNNVQDSLKDKMALRFRSSFPVESEIVIICSPVVKFQMYLRNVRKRPILMIIKIKKNLYIVLDILIL